MNKLQKRLGLYKCIIKHYNRPLKAWQISKKYKDLKISPNGIRTMATRLRNNGAKIPLGKGSGKNLMWLKILDSLKSDMPAKFKDIAKAEGM